MEESKNRMLVYDVEKEEFQIVERDDSKSALDQWYELIGCDCVDIVVWDIGGKRYDIVVDDNGWLKDNTKLAGAILYEDTGRLEPYLVGNLVFTGEADGDGATVYLSEEEAKRLWLGLTLRHEITVKMTDGTEQNLLVLNHPHDYRTTFCDK